MHKTTDARLRSPEAAKRLGVSGRTVYRLIFAGELAGRPDEDGIVYVSEMSVNQYLERHGFGHSPESPTGSSTGSTDMSRDEDARSITQDSRSRSSEARNDTEPNRPSETSEGS